MPNRGLILDRGILAALVASGLLVACTRQVAGPSPQLISITPAAICSESVSSTVTINGRGLSPLTENALRGPRFLAPVVALTPMKSLRGGTSTEPVFTIPDDPAAPALSDVTWTSQEQMAFTLCPPGTCSHETPPRTDLAERPSTGLYSIEVRNPSGGKATLAESLLIVPPPELTAMSEDLLCADSANTLTLTGQNFYEMKDEPGAILVGGVRFVPRLSDCRAQIAPEGVDIRACRTAEITIPAGSFMPGSVPVQVQGPGSITCRSSKELTLTFVPSPTVTAVTPELACLDTPQVTVTVKGTGFLTVGGALPAVQVGGHPFPPNLSECSSVMGPSEDTLSCETLRVDVPPEMLGTGIASVTVTNPAPAGCSVNATATLGVIPTPHLTSVAGDIACNAQGSTTFTVIGSDFVTAGGLSPTVTLSDSAHTTMFPAVASGCSPVAHPGGTIQACTQLSIEAAAATLASGTHSFTVANPAGCASSEHVNSLIVPPPVLTSVTPTPVCTAQGAVDLQVQGDGFLSIDGATPSLILTPTSGDPITLPTVASSCTTVAGVQESVRSCAHLTATAPRDSLAGDSTYSAVVTNPTPAACSSTGSVTLETKAPPVLDEFAPRFLCRGGGDVTLTGSRFRSGATVTIGTLQATSVAVNEAGTSATAHFGGGLPPSASYAVTLSAGDGCAATLQSSLAILDEPSVFFADPPVIWNGTASKVRLYGTDVTPPFASISLRPSGGGTAVPLTIESDAQHPSRVSVTIPAGTAAGAYDLFVTDSSTCPSTFAAGLKVVASTTLTGLSMAPVTGYTGSDTTVVIRSSGGFQAIPRVFLAPSGGAATTIRSVYFVNSTTLVAVVPAGFATGPYDLIVVNPDGTTGNLASAFTVLADPLPTITKLSPGAITYQTSQSFQILGTNFQAGAAVTLTCVDQSGAIFAGPAVTESSCGAGTTSTCIIATATVNAAGTCLVSVTNPDGGQFHYSSLVVQNPNARLGAFRAVSTMNHGRRGLGLAAVQATPTVRFLYALGGDDGNATGAVSSVEGASIDLFGNLGPWFSLRDMPSRHTLLGAVGIGRFVYAIAGSDGQTGAVKTVERAAVLDPDRAPTIADIDLAEGTGQGLSGGQYVYRVAAVMSASDPFNPNGEGLASSPYVVQLPDRPGRVQLTLSWNALPGVLPCPSTPPSGHAACGYRVYRSPSAGASSGSEVLIAENVAGTSLVDAGRTPLQINSASVYPVPLGTLGPWTQVSSLGTQRSGPAVTMLTDTSDPAVTYVYAMGGNDRYESFPNLLSSTEYLKVTTAADGSQTFGTWQGGPSLDTARWETGGFGLNVGGTNYLWAGPGRGSRGVTNTVEGSTVAGTGAPGNLNRLNDAMDDRAGYASLAANGTLFALGGAGGQPDRTIRQAQVSSPPEVSGWSTASSSLVEKRLNAAAVLQGGFVFVCGGRTDNAQAARSCETSVW